MSSAAVHNPDEATVAYGTYFLSSVAFAAQIPNLLFNWINIFVQFG